MIVGRPSPGERVAIAESFGGAEIPAVEARALAAEVDELVALVAPLDTFSAAAHVRLRQASIALARLTSIASDRATAIADRLRASQPAALPEKRRAA